MEPVKLPDGYRLPKGTTMADVRRLDQELLASNEIETVLEVAEADTA